MRLPRLNVEKFRTFVAESGATMLEPTNPYELIRFRCREGVGIVYRSGRGAITITGAAETAYMFFSRKREWRASKAYLLWERPEVVERLRERDGDNCFYCGKPLGNDFSVEHLVSVTHGGPSTHENLCLVHTKCNQAAGCLPLVEKIALFFQRKGK